MGESKTNLLLTDRKSAIVLPAYVFLSREDTLRIQAEARRMAQEALEETRRTEAELDAIHTRQEQEVLEQLRSIRESSVKDRHSSWWESLRTWLGS